MTNLSRQKDPGAGRDRRGEDLERNKTARSRAPPSPSHPPSPSLRRSGPSGYGS